MLECHRPRHCLCFRPRETIVHGLRLMKNPNVLRRYLWENRGLEESLRKRLMKRRRNQILLCASCCTTDRIAIAYWSGTFLVSARKIKASVCMKRRVLAASWITVKSSLENELLVYTFLTCSISGFSVRSRSNDSL